MKRSFLNSHAIEKMMATVIQQIQEPLPKRFFSQNPVGPSSDASDGGTPNIHFPTNPDSLRRAQYHRLKFEELFYVQLNILRYAKRPPKTISWIYL